MAKRPTSAITAEDQATTAAGIGAESAAVADTSAMAATEAQGAAAVQQATLAVDAAAPTNEKPGPRPERRGATVASRIDHDGELWLPDDIIVLTEAEFRSLERSGALLETSWDDCTLED